jgi:type VI secretion system secreted protein VgrG
MDDLTADFADFVQADRTIRIETPLGADVLLPERAELTEGVNALFEFRVAVRSKRSDIQCAEIVGQLADVSLDLDGAGARRTWNGLVVEMHEQPNVMRGFRRYVLTMRPQLWLLSQKSDCRIWQNLTTIDVLNALTSEHGLPAAQVSLLQPVPPQEYSVQFNETDLDYLRRRMEEDGLFFWHAHEPGRHTLNVADSAVAWKDAEPPDVRLSLGSSDKNNITAWSKRYLYTPGVRAGADWNFQTPTIVPAGKTNSLVQLPRNGSYELYEYPARIATTDEADRATKLRMQATEVDHERVSGASVIRTFGPAQRFKPYDLSNPEPPYEKHAMLEVSHTLIDRTYEPDETAPEYANTFVAMPSAFSATPHRATRRPRIDGAQTAIIAGPEGEEIWTDAFGRVKLWFPWDRRAKKDGSDTCWVRVIQSWGGGAWGAQVIPRINMEAMVAYQDGDPDRPVVVGLVPNPRQAVPYELPAQKTRMVMRSKSYLSQGANEQTFEDATANENYFEHAQKDRTGRVLNNHTHRVDANHVTSVGANQSVEVGGNHKTEVGGSVNLTVGGAGPMAIALMGQLGSLAPLTAGLLQQAGGVAGAGQGPGGIMAAGIGSSALGFLSGSGLASREGVVAGPSPVADAGDALRQAGAGVGADVGGILAALPGVMNTVVGAVSTRSVGVADVEQVGVSKVVNVGSVSLESVGKYKKIAVGEEFVIECGNSKLVMKSDGTVLILGTTFNFVATGHFQMRGDPIDCN